MPGGTSAQGDEPSRVPFPMQIDVKIPSTKLKLRLTIKDVKINRSVTDKMFKLKVPAHYEKVGPDSAKPGNEPAESAAERAADRGTPAAADVIA